MNRSGGILLRLVQVLLVVVVLAAGVGIFKFLSSRKKPPTRKERPTVAPLVEAIRVQPEDLQITVSGFGSVEAKTSVQVVTQVSGKVVYCHPDFVDGGFFKAEEALVKIDPRDYELAVQNAEATVAQAEYLLKQEQAEALVAKEEWDNLHGNEEPPSPLVLRIPQIKNAEAQLQSAKARLARANLDLERTTVSMPFDGRVVTKNVDLGQYVAPGQTLARVYATDVVEIIVPLEDNELGWFEAPLGYTNGNSKGKNPGPEATITAVFAGKARSWKGTVVRTEGQIDPTTRMVKVVVEVLNPFEQTDHNVPLTPGMFVTADIKGRDLKDVIRVPRYAVHHPGTVWLSRQGKLHIEPVEVLRVDKTHAYISSGLEAGDIVITSPLDVVTEGMGIRTTSNGSATSDEEVQK